MVAAVCLSSVDFLCADDPPFLPFNNTGDLFVLDSGCDCIVRITPEAEVSVHLTLQQIRSVTGQFVVRFKDVGIAFDAEGALYFLENQSGAILKQSTDGTLKILTTDQQLQATQGVSEVDLDPLARIIHQP